MSDCRAGDRDVGQFSKLGRIRSQRRFPVERLAEVKQAQREEGFSASFPTLCVPANGILLRCVQ